MYLRSCSAGMMTRCSLLQHYKHYKHYKHYNHYQHYKHYKRYKHYKHYKHHKHYKHYKHYEHYKHCKHCKHYKRDKHYKHYKRSTHYKHYKHYEHYEHYKHHKHYKHHNYYKRYKHYKHYKHYKYYKHYKHHKHHKHHKRYKHPKPKRGREKPIMSYLWRCLVTGDGYTDYPESFEKAWWKGAVAIKAKLSTGLDDAAAKNQLQKKFNANCGGPLGKALPDCQKFTFEQVREAGPRFFEHFTQQSFEVLLPTRSEAQRSMAIVPVPSSTPEAAGPDVQVLTRCSAWRRARTTRS